LTATLAGGESRPGSPVMRLFTVSTESNAFAPVPVDAVLPEPRRGDGRRRLRRL
jgi:hypothetical protein